MNAFYTKIETNRDFVKELFKLLESARKLNKNPKVSFYDKNGESMELQLYEARFTSKKRKGIEEGKTYLWMKTINVSRLAFDLNENKQLSLPEIMEIIISYIPENASFETPFVLDETNGSYYRLFVVGFDRFFNAAFWCEKIK